MNILPNSQSCHGEWSLWTWTDKDCSELTDFSISQGTLANRLWHTITTWDREGWLEFQINFFLKLITTTSILPSELTKLIKRHGGRNDVSSRLLPNCSMTLANRASAIDTVTDRKWAGPTSPRLYTMARDSCWVSKTNCANCHGNMKVREERERSKTCSLPGRWLLRGVHIMNKLHSLIILLILGTCAGHWQCEHVHVHACACACMCMLPAKHPLGLKPPPLIFSVVTTIQGVAHNIPYTVTTEYIILRTILQWEILLCDTNFFYIWPKWPWDKNFAKFLNSYASSSCKEGGLSVSWRCYSYLNIVT